MSQDHVVTAVYADRTSSLGRLQVFASAPDDPRARRPIDWIRAVLSLGTLVAVAVLAVLDSQLDSEVGGVLVHFPPFLQLLWLIGYWLAIAWSITMLACAAFGSRPLLAIEILGAALVALLVSALVAEIVTDDPSRVFSGIIDTDGPPIFPPAALAITAATVSTASPYLTLPFRRFGRALLGLQLLGGMFLGITLGSGAVASLAIGFLAGSTLHLVFGSPGGFPSTGRVSAALRQLGVGFDDVAPVRMRRDGVALLDGHDRTGPITVKVFGRDAWDGELFASMWLYLWYRDSNHSTRLKRSEQVEHEGFMTFLAARAGARVPEIITAGRADNGDALIVTRKFGTPLAIDDFSLTPTEVDSLWDQLAILHAAGITHRRIDLDRIVRHDDGTASFSDLSSSSVQAAEPDLLKDRAQLFGLSALASGEEVAVASARRALGDADLADVLPFLQEAALPPISRYGLNHRAIELDDIRNRLTETLGVEKPDLVKLRRVTLGSLLNMGLLTVAAYTIIGMLGGIDYEQFWDALQNANWWWLAIALFIGQTPRVSAAFSTIGSSKAPLPLGPTIALQFATCYINLTVPSSAGRVALTTRYFQRNGVPTTTALAAGFIDTMAQTLIQISLFVLIFLASDVDLDLSVDTDQLGGLATIALIALGVIVAALLVVACVPSVRRRVLAPVVKMKDAFVVLRMPRRVINLIGGNLGSEILFAMTLAIVTRAYGYELPLSMFVLINATVSLFSSLIPVPGGIGVTEAGLTLGLSRAGIPDESAFAIALSHRFITFYLPPFWGYASYKWLIKNRFL